MKALRFTVMAALIVSRSALAAETGVAYLVKTARQAEEIAARHLPPGTPDAEAKNWLASFDPKSKVWTACAGRPRSLPQSGFCVSIDAKTGRITGTEILN